MQVGDGATYRTHSDRHAGTIIEASEKKIVWQIDIATLDPSFKPNVVSGGFAGHCTNQDEQSYTYERNPEGYTMVFTLRKNGVWKLKGVGMNEPGCVLTEGRNQFHDYNY